MNLTFYNEKRSITQEVKDPDILLSLGGPLVYLPRVIDGMGERFVDCGCNRCAGQELTCFAEFIILEWYIDKKRCEKGFSGHESYLIQSIIHRLESDK